MATTPEKSASSADIERAHNMGQKDESDDRWPIARGWHTVGMSKDELEAYEKGEQNARENRSE